ncbi:hypothetical protein HN031_06160 [Nocardioides sp. zg-1308]|uniref:O-antigen ligase n=1 Tax=Nocardioides renjunii TaxID=3095075 RepID=A0ABU5K8C4_9ACTN|nr:MULTISPECIES: hypothetical protein [unclassified Nocardioides]MDZ5661151.1 hypothetical protein [Nocardioides sp. S-58]NPD04268.1 hypothetical protein [Nocardioides sp. zg-1308]
MLGKLGEFAASRLAPVWVTACVAAVMGPYLVSGLRTEQLAFYGSAAFVVLTQARSLLRVLAPVRWLLAVWGAYAVIAVVGGLLPVDNATPWESGSLLAGLDNALLPLATIVTVAYWCSVHPLPRIMAAVARTLVVVMSLNAVVALVGCVLGLGSLPWLRRFWAADGSSTYVAELAQQMGRFSGVFNQPAEAGIAYTLAAFSLAYLQKRGLTSPTWATVGWVLVVVGGMLTLSKVFVGGLVIALVLVLAYRTRVVRTGVVAVGTVAAMVALSAAGWFASWGASTMVGWYRSSIEAGDSPLYTLTAGRFGAAGTTGPPSIAVPVAPTEGATGGVDAGAEPAAALPTGVGELARVIYDEHPVFGVGARGLQVAYDSAWSEALVVGGLAGLALVVIAHLLVVGSSLLRMRALDRVHALLLAAVLVLTLAGSMGMPALTGNRESTLLWIFLVTLGFAGRTESTRLDEEHAQEVDPSAYGDRRPATPAGATSTDA